MKICKAVNILIQGTFVFAWHFLFLKKTFYILPPQKTMCLHDSQSYPAKENFSSLALGCLNNHDSITGPRISAAFRVCVYIARYLIHYIKQSYTRYQTCFWTTSGFSFKIELLHVTRSQNAMALVQLVRRKDHASKKLVFK